jgi:hypothetical protein
VEDLNRNGWKNWTGIRNLFEILIEAGPFQLFSGRGSFRVALGVFDTARRVNSRNKGEAKRLCPKGDERGFWSKKNGPIKDR